MRLLYLLAGLVVLLLPMAVEAQYFGKNKVQYKNFDWRVLETPHFEITYYLEEEGAVQTAARMAERSYTKLSRVLKHEFQRPIPLILYGSHADFQQTNITPGMIDVGTGGITELLRRRVFLPFTGSFAEFEHVLTHELVHAFQLDILLQRNGGDPMNPFGFAPPLWVMEGMAEYLSTKRPDTHTDMWVRDAALSGYLLSLESMAYVGDIRVYRFGQSIFQFLGDRYGPSVTGDLLRSLSSLHSLDKALQATTGLSLGEVSEQWMTEMRRKHLPKIAEHKLARETAEPLVTRHGQNASMIVTPSISPDGRYLAYVGDSGLTRDLYVMDLSQGGEPRRLVRGSSSGEFESLRFFKASSAWSPDNRTLAVAAQASGQDALYLLDTIEGQVVHKLAFGLDEVQTPSFSPDGEELVFVGLLQGRSNLYRVKKDGSCLRQLTDDDYAVRDPQWSPDGRSIVYVSDEGPETRLDLLEFGRLRLQILDLESGHRRDITPFAAGKAISPVWSGDGESIAFVSDQDGMSNIYVLHLPTGNVFRLTDLVSGVGGILPSSPSLSWSRDDDHLVFSVFRQAGWDVFGLKQPQRRMRPLEPVPGEIRPEVIALASHRLSGVDFPEGTDPVSGLRQEDFHQRDYKVRLSPDLSQVGSVVGYDKGVGGQSHLSFSDLLGNHTLSLGLGIYGSLKDSDLSIGYLNRARRTNYSLAAFQFRRRFGFLGAQNIDIENQTYRGARASLMRPFNKFSRLEASLQVAGVGGRYFLGNTADEAARNNEIDRVRAFVGPGFAYVMDTALYGATGPIMGKRFRASAEAGLGQLSFWTLENDYRQYWSLSRQLSLAARVFWASSFGSTPQSFYLGGSNTLRGYDYGSLVGNHALLASFEFRFPLISQLALGWPLPLRLVNVRGALFADAASAWDDEEWFRTGRAVRGDPVGRGPQISYGLGSRINLGGFILKMDWAYRYDTRTRGHSRGSNVSLGADF